MCAPPAWTQPRRNQATVGRRRQAPTLCNASTNNNDHNNNNSSSNNNSNKNNNNSNNTSNSNKLCAHPERSKKVS